MTNPILSLLRKEAKEMLRDKRIVNAAFIAPIFMIVLFIFLFGWLTTKVGDRTQIKLAIVRDHKNLLENAFVDPDLRAWASLATQV